MDEIERLPPAEGAEAVTFDYAAAESAVATIRAVRARIGECGGAAASLRDEAVVDWEGGHRIAFDEANTTIKTSIGSRLGLLDQMRSTVFTAAAAANELQAAYNRQAANDALATL